MADEKPEAVQVIFELVADLDSERDIYYSNYQYIYHSGHDFRLLFGDRSAITESQLEQARETGNKKLSAPIVAEVVLAPSCMRQFVIALATNYNKWLQTYGSDLKDYYEKEIKSFGDTLKIPEEDANGSSK